MTSKALYSIISHGDVVKRSFIYEDTTSPSEKYEVIAQTDDKPDTSMHTGDLKFAFNSALAHVVSKEHIGEIYNVYPPSAKAS